MQLPRLLPGHPITQPFGVSASPALKYEPPGIFQRDAGGELRRRAVPTTVPAGWTYAPRYHDGLDISAPIGTPIPALVDGTVLRCGAVAQAGATDANRYIAFRIAPGVALYLWHLNDWAASYAGKAVRAGELIAHVGNTGLSTGPHTHGELRRLESGGETKYNMARFFIGGDLEITPDGLIVPFLGGPTAMSYAYRVREFPTPRTFHLPAGQTLLFYDPERPGGPIYKATFPMEFTGQAVGPASVNWKNLGGAARPVPDSGGGYNFLEVGDVTPYPAGGVAATTYRGLIIVASDVTLDP